MYEWYRVRKGKRGLYVVKFRGRGGVISHSGGYEIYELLETPIICVERRRIRV